LASPCSPWHRSWSLLGEFSLGTILGLGSKGDVVALITWLAYGVYFHLHSLRRWSGRRSAGILVIAYGLVLFSYFGVNLWVAGLHSYAGG